jgi:hypothetical protein
MHIQPGWQNCYLQVSTRFFQLSDDLLRPLKQIHRGIFCSITSGLTKTSPKRHQSLMNANRHLRRIGLVDEVSEWAQVIGGP